MKRNFVTTALADPTKNLLLFLVFSTFGLTLASSAFSDLVLNSFGSWMQVQLNISKEAFRVGVFSLILLILLLVIAVTDLNDWLAKRYAPTTVKPKPLKATVGG